MKWKVLKEWNDDSLTNVEKILTNRGITRVNEYLLANEKNVHSPYLLDNIDVAIEKLIQYIMADEPIYVQVDSDADGYCSSATFINYMSKVFPNYKKWHIGLHPGKEHGLDMNQFYNSKAKLAIVPDAGSNEFDKHMELTLAGYSCIVLDHHEADFNSPHAVVVNPDLDEYPNKNLAGAGVVYKFCKAIDEAYGDIYGRYADDYLDLVGVATVGDMIDLRDPETKFLVHEGLSNVRNPFLDAIIKVQEFSMKGVVTPTTIGFYVAPLVNATIRVGTQDEKRLMFEAMLEKNRGVMIPSTKRGEKGMTELLTTQAARNAVNIRARQGRMVDKAMDFIEGKITFEGLNDHKVLLIQSEGQVPKEITGLVANKVMYKFQKPTLILHDTDETLSGSGRGYDKSSLSDFKEFLLESGYAEYAQGHGNAFGFSIKKDNVADFLNYSNESLKDLDFTPQWLVDFEWDAATMKPSEVYEIGMMANMWGKGVDESKFVIKNIPLTKKNTDVFGSGRSFSDTPKKQTLKITHNRMTYLKFGVDQDLLDKIESNAVVNINVVGKANINDYNGTITPQVFIEDYEVASIPRFYF